MTSNNPLVSVNITTYNRAALLERCLCSVLGQTYVNLELVVVDDCSSDSTQEVLSHFARSYKNITSYRNSRNLGNARARNIALDKSSGFYIAFMDDDDEWIDPYKIEKQVELISADPSIGLVCTSVRRYASPVEYRDQIVAPQNNIEEAILSGNGFIYSPSVLTRSSLLRKIRFDERLPRGVDSDFYRSVILREGMRVHFCPEICVAVHEYGTRLTPLDTVNSNFRNLKSHLIAIIKYLRFYPKYPRALFKRLYSIAVSFAKIILLVLRKFGWTLRNSREY